MIDLSSLSKWSLSKRAKSYLDQYKIAYWSESPYLCFFTLYRVTLMKVNKLPGLQLSIGPVTEK